MNSTIYTVEMQGLGGGSSQYLFLLFGFAASSVEPTNEFGNIPVRIGLRLGVGM